MKVTLANRWEEIRTSFWFVPTLLFLAAVFLSFFALQIDIEFSGDIPPDAWWIYGGGADGARSVLAAIAGSMITVTSVVFSITIVVLTLASGQFGSRLLRNFMRDTGNQVVLGTFLATFIYSLLILRRVRSTGDFEFIPYLSVTLGVLMVFFSVAVLIYFIHHVSTNIQAETIINGVFHEITRTVDILFDEPGDDSLEKLPAEPEMPERFIHEPYLIKADESNYMLALEEKRLVEVAAEHDLFIRMIHRPGDFVIRGSAILKIWSSEPIKAIVKREISETLLMGVHRTITQDAEYGIHQLVEIAVRALSPSINDPYTAINCIDRLAAVMSQIAQKKFPSPYRYDDEGNFRLILNTTSFEGYLDASYHQIRQNAGENPAVLIRMLEALTRIAEQTFTREQNRALQKHAEMVMNKGHTITEERDLNDLKVRYNRITSLLKT